MPLSARSRRSIPNLVTGARIALAPLLVALALTGARAPFAWLLAAALASDILDGWLARRWGVTSSLGSLLDSIADLLTMAVAALGMVVFHRALVQQHGPVFTLVIGLWMGVSLIGWLRYGRLASFHTLLARVAAYAMGLFIGVLFLWGFVPWLFWSAAVVAVTSQVEELVLMALLPRWTPNVRGLRRALLLRAGAR